MDAERAYRETRRLLLYVVRREWSRRGGDLEEMVSRAHLVWAEAWATHDPMLSEFRDWLCFNLRRALRRDGIDAARRRHREVTLEPQRDPGRARGEDVHSSFVLEEFLAALDGDALEAARTAVDMPPAVAFFGKRGDPRSYARPLRRHLRDSGWSLRRVTAAFARVREALRP